MQGGLQSTQVEVAGKGPGPLDDADFLVGSDWLSNATAITFAAGMRGAWTHHTGSAPILGGGLVGK